MSEARVSPPPADLEVFEVASCPHPLISVVLPTFNRAPMLTTSIESVLSQTEANFELIVVDDGSTDDTLNAARKHARSDNRITVVRQSNRRLPRALNTGFRIARGEFFTWTSDDNRYRPEAFAVLSQYLHGRPDVGLVFAEMFRRGPTGLKHTPVRRPLRLWENNKFGGVFMYRRSVAAAAGEYDPDLELVEDYDYLLRLTYHASVCHLPDVLYEYLDHDESLTARRLNAQYGAMERMLYKHVQMGLARRSDLSRLAACVSRSYQRLGLQKDAIRLARLSWSLWPFNLVNYKNALFMLRCFARSDRSAATNDV